jgi:antirestriction protein ArdC
MRDSRAEAAFLHIIDTSRLIKVLNADRREIFRAAADAQRIADYCLGLHPDYRNQPDDAGAEADDLPAAA